MIRRPPRSTLSLHDALPISSSRVTRRSETLCSEVSCSVICWTRSEEHTSELQSRFDLVCRLLLEKKTQDLGRRIVLQPLLLQTGLRRLALCRGLIRVGLIHARLRKVVVGLLQLRAVFFLFGPAPPGIHTLSLHDALPI